MHTGYNRDLYTIFGPARPGPVSASVSASARPGISFGISFGPARPSISFGPAFAWLRPPGRTYSAISPAITSLIV